MKNKRFLYLSLSFFLISLGLALLSFSSYKPVKAATGYGVTYSGNVLKTASDEAQPVFGDDTINYSLFEPFVYSWDIVVTEPAFGTTKATEKWTVLAFKTIKESAVGPRGSIEAEFKYTGDGRMALSADSQHELSQQELFNLSPQQRESLIRTYKVTVHIPEVRQSDCALVGGVGNIYDTKWVPENIGASWFKSNIRCGDVINNNSLARGQAALWEGPGGGLNGHFNPTEWVISGTIN
ncbi:MAG: hypothetical protein US31_C0012G0028 [Berkelbacteria bacterium GW2011_GWA1_36_9]|uniref:Uncharacterized protein n=1 Tax=Berkelbacteria bacterium GW2011_GWA1_36_9 TaxID=1618331 RepID=A0A0G0FJH2_9BACT|nr:MAG: hypothetical protein US31_C0012G0028 [Berkelbacteria bacterium GW2011_GWA1_36_9]